ncbi:MAG: glycine cleavage system aminomethyltransferase GcvT [Betaproteobacteria bacterium]|nr:glycine cleavage system aminomethyltransferase GcvT [Betaproteobacteria bacterium]
MEPLLTDTPSSTTNANTALLRTPLYELHLELGARMVPFAGYSMPVQYPAGLMAEHLHTRSAAGLFDVSHMGQLSIAGAEAAAALESLMPVDVVGLAPGRQRYGMLLTEDAGILDDLMFTRRTSDYLVIVNGACKVADTAHIQQHIGTRCRVTPLPDAALLALQGPLAVKALERLVPGVGGLVFMSGGDFVWQGHALFITRSGYTGEDGYEISVHAEAAQDLARALLQQPEVKPIGLGARNSLRLEAGLCLHGNDIDHTTTPAEANLLWAVQKVRRSGGARAGGFPGAQKLLAHIDSGCSRVRVGLRALERVPVREHTALHLPGGAAVGEVTSGLLGPSADAPIAMAYVDAAHSAPGIRLDALVRGKPVPMQICPMPFVPHRYHRG